MNSLPEPVESWMQKTLGPGLSLTPGAQRLPQFREDGPWMMGLESSRGSRQVVVHIGDPSDEDGVGRFNTEVAALTVAEQHRLPVPTVLAADLTGSESGHLVIVETALSGNSEIPMVDEDRSSTFGRVIALIHQVHLEPSRHLPVRTKPLSGQPFESFPIPDRSAEVFDRARAYVAAAEPPSTERCLVHGDLWLGNSMWTGQTCTGLLDWDFAGVGSPGVDLGSARCDVTFMFGDEAAELLLSSWQEITGITLNMAYWDVVAGLASPPDLALWLPNFHAQGRTDLDLDTVTRRRDRFISTALEKLV